MSDDIVVIDNGQTYETQETSIVAKEEADRAERWAKFAEEQANLASGQAIEAAEASDAAAQAATVTVENSNYVKGLLDNDGFRAVAADMLAEPSSIKTALENANNAAADADNAAADADNAAESATIASQQAEDAQHWAKDSSVWAKKAERFADKVTGSVTAIEGKIGDIGFSAFGIDESLNTRRYLNGQVISQDKFKLFAEKIKEAIKLYPNIATSETNWQAEVTNSKLGQCGKFVIDDTAGTIRLPKVVNINGLTDLSLMGGIKAESLPNITGTFRGRNAYNGNASINESVATGAFGTRDESGTKSGAQESGENRFTWAFNASRSSSTYQDGAPVQQEAVQYPYFIQVATSTEESVDVTREIELNNPFSLLDYKWSEYELNNASWLLSNGAFHSGATYVAVYELLLKIYNGTETKDGVSVKLSTEAYTDTDFVINTAEQTFRLPIKVKLASGNAVVGSGMTLGWTDGTRLAGTGNSSNDSSVRAYINNYGKSVGSSNGSGDLIHSKVIGVTTDPTKSGIETSSSGLKLYFYVGETIQDANVINAAGVLTKVANGIDRTVKTDRETIVSWGMPDYTAGVTCTKGTLYTLDFPVVVVVDVDSLTSLQIYKDGVLIKNFAVRGQLPIRVPFLIPKGYSFKSNISTAEYFPLQGVN